MILFQKKYNKPLNQIVHVLLHKEIYNSSQDVGDLIDEVVPKYLRREQFLKCKKHLNNYIHGPKTLLIMILPRSIK